MHLARHLTDAELGAVLDAAGGGTRGDVARAHAAVCAVCRSAIVEAQEAEREVAAMLRHLDHPAPPLDVESIEVAAEPTIALRGVAGLDAASGRGTRTSTLRLVRVVPGDFEDEGRGRAARGSSARAARKGIRRGVIALACTAAAAAAAVPGSPVRHAIGHLISPRPVPASRAAPVPAAGVPRARPAQLSPAVRGVAIAAGRHIEIVFRAPDRSGELRIHSGMSPQVAVTATGDGPVYSVAAGRLVIDNRSVSGLAYDIELPPATARADLSIRVGNRLVFARQGATVTAESAAGDNGAYVIPMAAIGVR